MNKMQALHNFWSSFELKAYDENSVPENAELPFITYEASSDSFGNTLLRTASLWYRSSSWESVTAKEKEISETITRGGYMIPFDGGTIWLQRSTPWAQRMGDPSDDMIKRIVLTVSMEFLDKIRR